MTTRRAIPGAAAAVTLTLILRASHTPTGGLTSPPSTCTSIQGLTLVHVRAQLEQLQDTFMS